MQKPCLSLIALCKKDWWTLRILANQWMFTYYMEWLLGSDSEVRAFAPQYPILARLKDNVDWFEARHIKKYLNFLWPWKTWYCSSHIFWNFCTYGSLRQWCRPVLHGPMPDPTRTWILFYTRYPTQTCLFIPVPALVITVIGSVGRLCSKSFGLSQLTAALIYYS